MWDDLSKSVKAQLYERVSSPLFGSFVLAWGCWNYRFILVLIGSGEPEKKLAYIDTHIFRDYYDVILRGMSLPFVSAIVFIYLYPLVSKSLYRYWQGKQKELKEIQQKIEDDTPITQEEARQLRYELRQKAVEHDKAMKERESQIAELTQLVREKDEQLNGLSSRFMRGSPAYQPQSEPELDESKLKMLEALASQSLAGISYEALLKDFGPDIVKTEADIDQLQNDQYASEFSERGERKMRITSQGRKRFLIEREKRNGNLHLNEARTAA